jgi:hypothetical protein
MRFSTPFHLDQSDSKLGRDGYCGGVILRPSNPEGDTTLINFNM